MKETHNTPEQPPVRIYISVTFKNGMTTILSGYSQAEAYSILALESRANVAFTQIISIEEVARLLAGWRETSRILERHPELKEHLGSSQDERNESMKALLKGEEQGEWLMGDGYYERLDDMFGNENEDDWELDLTGPFDNDEIESPYNPEEGRNVELRAFEEDNSNDFWTIVVMNYNSTSLTGFTSDSKLEVVKYLISTDPRTKEFTEEILHTNSHNQSTVTLFNIPERLLNPVSDVLGEVFNLNIYKKFSNKIPTREELKESSSVTIDTVGTVLHTEPIEVQVPEVKYYSVDIFGYQELPVLIREQIQDMVSNASLTDEHIAWTESGSIMKILNMTEGAVQAFREDLHEMKIAHAIFKYDTLISAPNPEVKWKVIISKFFLRGDKFQQKCAKVVNRYNSSTEKSIGFFKVEDNAELNLLSESEANEIIKLLRESLVHSHKELERF